MADFSISRKINPKFNPNHPFFAGNCQPYCRVFVRVGLCRLRLSSRSNCIPSAPYPRCRNIVPDSARNTTHGSIRTWQRKKKNLNAIREERQGGNERTIVLQNPPSTLSIKGKPSSSLASRSRFCLGILTGANTQC